MQQRNITADELRERATGNCVRLGIVGGCLEALQIPDGCTVIVDLSRRPTPGEVCVCADRHGIAMCKQYVGRTASGGIDGMNLQELRGSVSREFLAAALGISVAALTAYEQGERVPRDEVKERFALFFGKSVQEIFTERKNECNAKSDNHGSGYGSGTVVI